MLDKQDNDRDRNLASKHLDDIGSDSGHSSMLESTRDVTQKPERRILLGVLVDLGNIAVDQPTDHSVKENDEDGTQSRAEEQKSAVLGELVSSILESKSQKVEEDKSGKTHGSIKCTSAEMLQDMDNNKICCVSG